MHSPMEPGPDGPSLPTDLAVRFIERESAGFAATLRTPSDPQVLQDALRWHDDAHRPWLALLRACDRAGAAGAARLHRLYTFHGRLAELLQRGHVGTEALRALLEAHLDQLTCEAVAGLQATAHPPPSTGGVSASVSQGDDHVGSGGTSTPGGGLTASAG